MLLGIIDIFCIYFVKLRQDNFVLIQVTVILGYFRILRFIPLIKVKCHISKYRGFCPTLFVRCVNKPRYLEGNREGALFTWNAVSTGVCMVHSLIFSQRLP